MAEHPIQGLMNVTMDKIRQMADSNTIIGEPITTPDGVTVIPVSRVSFGFGAGGGDYGKTERTFDTTEILLDEAVTSADETRALGIETGDIVCFDPRTRVTASGYIKSRFLDDKLSVGILLGSANYHRDEYK